MKINKYILMVIKPLIFTLIILTMGCKGDKIQDEKALSNSPQIKAEWLYFQMDESYLVERTGKLKDGFKEGDWGYNVNNTLNTTISWRRVRNDSLELIVPSSWNIKEKSKYFFAATIPNKNNSHFVVIKTDTLEQSAIDYLSSLYGYSFSDTTETLVKYGGNYIDKKDGNSFITYQFEYQKGNQIWDAIGAIVLHQNRLYDIAFRMERENSNEEFLSIALFSDILSSLSINSLPVIGSLEDIADVKPLDFTGE